MGKKLDIRQKLLVEMGITRTHPDISHHHKLTPVSLLTRSGQPKTVMMRYLEGKYGNGRDLEELLLSGSLTSVQKLFGGEISTAALSKWIKRLHLRYTVDNLPPCTGCKHYQASCEGGICHLLIMWRRWELIEAKKTQILSKEQH